MSLKVLVRDKAISISIKLPKDLESTRFTRTEGRIFNLSEQATQSASSCLIFDITISISCCQLLVDESRRWIGSLPRVQRQGQLVCVLLEDKRGDRCNVSGSMDVVLEGREEAFKVFLR